MFSWFTRHVAYLFFLRTAAFRLSKGKGNRTTANFSQRHLCRLTLLEFSSLDIPLFTFSSLSLCIPGFVSFQDRRNLFYILAWPRNGENWERVVCSTPYRSLSFSLRLLPSSFAVAWNIKFPIRVCRLRTSFQEITSLF